MTPEEPQAPETYYRQDQDDGVTAPDLTKTASYAEHIVHARGKRTQFTSVSLSKVKVLRFGPTSYVLLRDAVEADGHDLIEHQRLMAALRRSAQESDKIERAQALQAIRYAGRAQEGLVDWHFDIGGVARKDVITWAWRMIQKYFRKQ